MEQSTVGIHPPEGEDKYHLGTIVYTFRMRHNGKRDNRTHLRVTSQSLKRIDQLATTAYKDDNWLVGWVWVWEEEERINQFTQRQGVT